MQSVSRSVMPLLVVLAALSSPALAARDGIDYSVDADTLVYGGSYFWAQTQNPADVHTLYVEQLRTHVREILHRSEGGMSEIQAAPKGNLAAVFVDLREYRGIVPPWNDWTAVQAQCRSLAAAVLAAP